MNILGIYGSPRKKGNSDILLDKVLEGAKSAGGDIHTIYIRDLKMIGCIECGGCDRTGKCVVKDDMQKVYPMLESADIVFLASPIFFYNVSAFAKALIDRCQAPWRKRMLTKTREERRNYDSGSGYLIAVGASAGKRLFEGAELTAKYFFDALDMSYEGAMLIKNIDTKGAILEHPDLLKEAFDFGTNAVKNYKALPKTE